jgi:Flp pilus assembly protein TadB
MAADDVARIAIIAFVCLWMALVLLSGLNVLRFLGTIVAAALLEWRDQRRLKRMSK